MTCCSINVYVADHVDLESDYLIRMITRSLNSNPKVRPFSHVNPYIFFELNDPFLTRRPHFWICVLNDPF